ncbi:hypothetical protein FJT64_008773 [Amphibalanus amphitrite]|uniref:Single domain-containing protein n=1 Tax=Amphibalanus amphitrite TaxID=1232801 RepID=A0A6A4VRS0_AMPAM|nr:hypothetical protein FJT64_008773 [Amphibalanus amphitrite]
MDVVSGKIREPSEGQGCLRQRCPIVGKNVDFTRLKKENYFCREASGDRNKQFPSCCPSLQCKHYVKGKLVPLPKHMYPTLRCPVVSKTIDFTRLKRGNFFCREASGDRNKQFPSCCPSLQCKHYVKGKCPLVAKNVDFDLLKSGNYYCRQAWGNRNKQFPSCCPSLQCKHYVKGKLEPLPKHMYPYLH